MAPQGPQTVKLIPFDSQYWKRFFIGYHTNQTPIAPPWRRSLGGLIEFYDAITAGNDIEVSSRNSIIRRPGNSAYTSASFAANEIPLTAYSFKRLDGTLPLIVDTNQRVTQVTTTAITNIFTKTATSQSYFQSVGNYLYWGDGINVQKYNSAGSGGGTNVNLWGIETGKGSNTTTALFAGTGTDAGGASNTWVSPANFTGAPDGVFTTSSCTNSSGGPNLPTDNLQGTTYGFALPVGATVVGIQVALKGLFSRTDGCSTAAATVSLLKNGAIAGTAKVAPLALSNTVYSLGSTTDLWGTTWGSTETNATNFGVNVQCSCGFGGCFSGTCSTNISMDSCQVTITYTTGGPAISVSASAGTFSATTGYQYVTAFGNSTTGHVGSASLASASTGVFTNKLNVQVTLTASSDPQVNQIRLYRTKDGGSTFYELPTSPYANTSTNITESAADGSLVTTLIAPINSVNNPPPSGLINCVFHMGRMWGSVGNLVYYAGGPDTFNGVGTEAWPPLNFFTFPSPVVRMVSAPPGLVIFTQGDAYIIRGVDSFTFYSEKWQQNLALRNWNALDTDGDNIFMYTADRQLVEISTSGVTEVGFAIADTLNSLDPTKVQVAIRRSGSLDSAVFVSDGAAKWYRYDLNFQIWSPPATPQGIGGIQMLRTAETTAGVFDLLIGSATAAQSLYRRDATTNQDAGNNYSPSGTFGSVVMATPGHLTEIDSIVTEVNSAGTVPSVSVLLNDTSGTFISLPAAVHDPPELPQSVNLRANRYYLAQASLSKVTRFMSVKLTWAAENAANELWGLAIFGGPIR